MKPDALPQRANNNLDRWHEIEVSKTTMKERINIIRKGEECGWFPALVKVGESGKEFLEREGKSLAAEGVPLATVDEALKIDKDLQPARVFSDGRFIWRMVFFEKYSHKLAAQSIIFFEAKKTENFQLAYLGDNAAQRDQEHAYSVFLELLLLGTGKLAPHRASVFFITVEEAKRRALLDSWSNP